MEQGSLYERVSAHRSVNDALVKRRTELANQIAHIQTHPKTAESRELLAKALEEIRLVKEKLRDNARVDPLMGFKLTKTDMIDRLMQWKCEIQDAAKNPKTSAAEKLFGARATERIDRILKQST